MSEAAFKTDLKGVGLSQRQYGKLLDKDTSTVFRWLNDCETELEIPQYARVVVDLLKAVPAGARAKLFEKYGVTTTPSEQ